MTGFSLSRRAALAGAAAFTVAPMAASAGPQASPIAALWARAERLKAELAPFAETIRVKTSEGGISGWMRMTGAANRLGHQRHATLVAILNEAPQHGTDLAIMAKASRDNAFLLGGQSWAAEKLASAAMALHGASA
jgi:hypothetical protein